MRHGGKPSSTGLKGVDLHMGKYHRARAYIKGQGMVFIGLFDTPQAAAEAVQIVEAREMKRQNKRREKLTLI